MCLYVAKLNITFESMLYKESTKGINFITMQIIEGGGLKLICLIFLSLSSCQVIGIKPAAAGRQNSNAKSLIQQLKLRETTKSERPLSQFHGRKKYMQEEYSSKSITRCYTFEITPVSIFPKDSVHFPAFREKQCFFALGSSAT
jgi:hypothetical protein